MTTVRLTVEYDGTDFCGFQFQPNVRTVAGELESVLSRIFSETVKITGAGRTDAGVHATGQVVSFTTSRENFPFDRLPVALNSALPDDVTIRESALVDDGFSARFAAVERNYVYAILNRREPYALLRRYTQHVYRAIDLDRFGDAAAHLIGRHNFRSFCAVPPPSGNTVRTVHALNVRRAGDLIRVHIAADGFLHKMVRTIVGTLIECGTGRREPAEIPAILRSADRRQAGLTAEPQGLYFTGVRYRDGYDSSKEPSIFQG